MGATWYLRSWRKWRSDSKRWKLRLVHNFKILRDLSLITTVRTSYIKSKPLYVDRARLIEQLPGFWATVLQADGIPAVIESSIQAGDLPILSSLTSIDVMRSEVEKDPECGDPRSFTIAFHFDQNDTFENRVLEKSFWYQKSKDGHANLVSEAIPIDWCRHKIIVNSDGPESLEDLTTKGESFFAFFGYRGWHNSPEQSSEADETIKAGKSAERGGSGNSRGRDRHEGSSVDLHTLISSTISSAADEVESLADEAFPEGEELAIAISEDLFPGALKYFGKAQYPRYYSGR